MSKRPARLNKWDFARKFNLWLVDNGESLAGFAKRAGIPQTSMHGYARTDTPIPAKRLYLIAQATGLPMEYWMSEEPYPPPQSVVVDAYEAMLAKHDPEDVAALMALLDDPEELRRLLRVYRAYRAEG